MTALEYLKLLRDRCNCLPLSKKADGTFEIPSNNQLRVLLKNKSIQINGVRPDVFDEIEFPITELIFFPKSGSRVTIR